MMTDKQKWFLTKLVKQLEEKDPEKYNTEWFIINLLFWGNDLSVYKTSKREASHDIQLCLDELNA